MKRLVFLVAGLATLVMAAAAFAAPAPKTTGDIGYTAYSDVQRHLTFNAIQSTTNTCSVFWNVAGVSSFSFVLTGDTTVYTHDAFLAQAGEVVTGNGGYPVGGLYAFSWHITTGSVIGNTLSLTILYDTGATGTVMHMTGTIASNGSITGTWNDNYGGARTGTFTASGATPIVTYCGKGMAYYSDASGLWYLVSVTAVSVDGPNANAWFAGPVIASNFGAEGNWLFAKVHDGGEPGYRVDAAWGSFTDQVTAINGVTSYGTPGDGPFFITSGNLQVH